MNGRVLTIGALLVMFCGGCASVKRVTDDPRFFGGFHRGGHYVTKVETIVTPDLRHALYGELFFPRKRLFLVPVNTGAATNYISGKFSGLKRADPVSEVGRLPVGTRLEFIGIETIVVALESPRPAIPLVRVLDGPFKDNELCIYHLCADRFVWGWPQTADQHSDLDNGRKIRVFSPSELFLTREPK